MLIAVKKMYIIIEEVFAVNFSVNFALVAVVACLNRQKSSRAVYSAICGALYSCAVVYASQLAVFGFKTAFLLLMAFFISEPLTLRKITENALFLFMASMFCGGAVLLLGISKNTSPFWGGYTTDISYFALFGGVFIGLVFFSALVCVGRQLIETNRKSVICIINTQTNLFKLSMLADSGNFAKTEGGFPLNFVSKKTFSELTGLNSVEFETEEECKRFIGENKDSVCFCLSFAKISTVNKESYVPAVCFSVIAGGRSIEDFYVAPANIRSIYFDGILSNRYF